MSKRALCIIVIVISVVLLGLYEFVGPEKFGITPDQPYDEIIGMAFTRGLGGLVFTLLLWYLGYNVMLPERGRYWSGVLFSLPAFAVAINNLHIYTLITGQERVCAPPFAVILLFFECLLVGLFEEMAFRGVVFLKILEKRRSSILDVVVSILLSSAVFGAIHSVNFLYSSPIYVIQQIGYSFLIGAMCSVVLLKTKNIWICVLVHGIFNFGGSLVPTLGVGFVWDVPTIVLTVIFAAIVTVYMTLSLIRMPMSEIDGIYLQKGHKV